VTGRRCVAIHGHFYQPPRENPWLEAIEVQDAAAPHHDWNARVAAECYAPNTAARRTDARGRILDIVSNFERISFNVGPTLLAWLAAERPEVYARIVEADRLSARARGGHGNALAQVYNHVIMPLASRRDKVTQVRWGIADFRHRFGRDPEGMWLPETAVDAETLAVLAEQGIRFTILSPTQALRVRALADGTWREVGARIDPSRAYRWDGGGGGRALALFFYDGPISHAIAFEGLLGSADALVARIRQGFDPQRTGAQLVHVATDGESYGHHHRFGEMALAAACHQLEGDRDVTLTNYGAFLAAHPPVEEVEVVAPSSWSCAHGVDRWRADCGCNTGRPGWHQAWRAPLREALDWLRDAVDGLYERQAGVHLRDPWAARDDYVDVVLDRSPAGLETFLDRHGRGSPGDRDRVEAVRLLELQRNRLLMYTSCAWFFDEISGIETVQVLRYAARVLQLVRELDGPAYVEDGFLRRLAAAPSNVPELGTGDAVYRRHVLPAVVDLRRVVAHYAITAPYEAYGGETAAVYAYRVTPLDWHRESYGDTSLAVGRVRVASAITAEAREGTVAVLHFGGSDFHCAVRDDDGERFASLRDELVQCFLSHSLSDVVRALDRWFSGKTYDIRDLFLEARRRVLAAVTEEVLRRHEDTYRRLYEENRRLLRYLREVETPAPEALVLAARYVLHRDVNREIRAVAETEQLSPRLGELLEEARALGIDLALGRDAAAHLTRALLRHVEHLGVAVTAEEVGRALALLDLSRQVGCALDLWAAQNRLFELWRAGDPARRRVLAPLAAALDIAVDGGVAGSAP
jgi:alpha-amylase/alpha-mannosidase (GH57 family)